MKKEAIQVIIPIEPKPWKRVKRGAYGQAYVPGPTRNYQRTIARLFPPQKTLFDCPLSLQITFVMPKPKRPKFSDWPAVTPDLDNLVKNVKDALNGVAWTDDARICEVMAQKVFDLTPGGGKPRIHIMVKPL